MDDIREAQLQSGVNFGKYFFVSCWTQEHAENIPQWHMYGQNMHGVRIELPEYPFDEIPMVSPRAWTGIQIQDGLTVPVPFEAFFGKNYFLVPMFFHRRNFAGTVSYISDVKTAYGQSVSKEIAPDGISVSMRINNLPGLSFLKSKHWEFQKEYRFSLFALPSKELSIPVTADAEYFGDYSRKISNAFINNLDQEISFIDLPLSDYAIKKLVVRTGPLATRNEKVAVKQLVAQFAPEAKIEESEFSGAIREKKQQVARKEPAGSGAIHIRFYPILEFSCLHDASFFYIPMLVWLKI